MKYLMYGYQDDYAFYLVIPSHENQCDVVCYSWICLQHAKVETGF